MIGGNMDGVIQIQSDDKNEYGQNVPQWVVKYRLQGWFDYTGGQVETKTFQAKVENSTHIFICDYQSLSGVENENCRMIIVGNVYEVLLIDDPMQMHQQLEIYLKLVGGQNG